MNDNERSNLARTIRKYREARKMTMKQLSIKSGINLSTIKKYETDTSMTQNPVSALDENKNRLLLTNKGIKKIR